MTKGTRSGGFYFTVISLSGGCGWFYIPGCQTAGGSERRTVAPVPETVSTGRADKNVKDQEHRAEQLRNDLFLSPHIKIFVHNLQLRATRSCLCLSEKNVRANHKSTF